MIAVESSYGNFRKVYLTTTEIRPLRPMTYFKDNRDNKNNGKNRRNGRCHEVTYNKYNGDYLCNRKVVSVVSVVPVVF